MLADKSCSDCRPAVLLNLLRVNIALNLMELCRKGHTFLIPPSIRRILEIVYEVLIFKNEENISVYCDFAVSSPSMHHLTSAQFVSAADFENIWATKCRLCNARQYPCRHLAPLSFNYCSLRLKELVTKKYKFAENVLTLRASKM